MLFCGKHDKDATFAYQIVETERTFTYDAAGKLLTATETEDNYGTCVYTFEYDLMGNRTYMEKTLNGTVVEWHRYEYNESNQLISEKLYNGKKTTSLAYTYDADGNREHAEGQVYQSYRYSVTGEITFGAPQYENEYTYNGESYNPNIQSQYLRARYYCVVTATFLTEDSYLGSLTEPLTLNRYNYCVSSYLNYTDPSGNEVEVLESLKGWIIDPDTQAQKTIENYENQRLSLEDAIESGLLNNRAGQIFLDYGDVIMGPPVTLPSSLVGIREAIKGNSDSKEMQRTATAGFYAGFVGQGLEYVQIISKADYQLSLLIVTQKGLNAAANPLTYVEYFRNFSPQEKLEAAKRTAKGAWNGEYDSALGRKTGAATLDYLLVAIGGALMKGESAACEVAESGSGTGTVWDNITPTQENYPYTNIPKSFEIEVNGEKMWVHGNATEHMYEDVYKGITTGNGTAYTNPNLYTQEIMSDFCGSLQEATKSGIVYGEKITQGNWEFIFAQPRQAGQLPVIKHAQFNGWH